MSEKTDQIAAVIFEATARLDEDVQKRRKETEERAKEALEPLIAFFDKLQSLFKDDIKRSVETKATVSQDGSEFVFDVKCTVRMNKQASYQFYFHPGEQNVGVEGVNDEVRRALIRFAGAGEPVAHKYRTPGDPTPSPGQRFVIPCNCLEDAIERAFQPSLSKLMTS